MKKLLVRLLATLGALLIVGVVVAGIAHMVSKGRVPGKTVLEIDFQQPLVEYVPDAPAARLLAGGKQPRVLDVVQTLERAGDDPRVVGLVARCGSGGLGLATVQELRDAVAAFRAKGKPATAFIETTAEAGPGNAAYYLATAFDQIYLQPSGDIGLTGLLREAPFIRGTLDKLGFVPRFDHRSEYKTAMNLLTEKKFTDAHRESATRVLDSHFGQLVRDIAAARKMTEEEVRELMDRGPFLGPEALDAKLVDGLLYRDEVYAKVKDRAGKGAKLLYLSKYRQRAGTPYAKGKTVALIFGVGGVQRGRSGYDPVFQDVTMGSDTIAAAFRAAVEDKDVKAILFRVNSPGGSYVASDTIWREVARARKAGKPVIVSMGDVAGSGGYFVSMPADKIVAHPATLTASIGVVSGKFVTTNFWDKLGITWDEVHTSSNAQIWTGLADFTPEQWAKFQSELDRIYDDFTTKVAEDRRLPKETVLEIAKGRVWTGEDAKQRGLVDELGGFPVAMKLVREAAGLKPDEKIKLKEFPARKTFLERLLAEEPDSSEPAAEALTRAMKLLAPFARVARQAGLYRGSDDVLVMPEF
jgi:protease-4